MNQLINITIHIVFFTIMIALTEQAANSLSQSHIESSQYSFLQQQQAI